MNTPKRVLNNRNLNNVNDGNFGTPIKIPGSPFLEKLGHGTGVQVFRLKRALSPDGKTSPWAVKCLSRIKGKSRIEQYAALYNQRLVEEANFLRALNHPNIVGFRAFKKSNDGRECLAMEDCNGSLGDLLETCFEEGNGPLPVENINKVCLDITSGLEYLHTKALLLHGDIKSFNVLVKGDFEICKLCDFGVSQPVNEKGELDRIKKPNALYVGTELWSAPEVLEDPQLATIKADMFSFGMVIYEMIALQPPHTLNQDINSIIVISDDDDDDGMKNDDSENFQPEIPYGTRPSIPDVFDINEDYNHILEAFYVCTHDDPVCRPTAKILHDLFVDKKTN